MKILIVTESSSNGINRNIALKCENILRAMVFFTEYDRLEIKNASEVNSKTEINEYDYIIMVVPEWNGSFPHTFKAMIDSSGYPSSFEGKEILLIGTSNTTFGNLIGITHLSHILEWIGADVFNARICIPNIGKLDLDIEYEDRLKKQLNKFLLKYERES